MQELSVESNTSSKRPLQRASVLERTKQKIVDANLVTDLIQFVKGELEMTTAQANTALRLVGKFMPDLQATSHQVDINHNVVDIHTLNARLSALGHDPQSVFAAISQNKPIDAVYNHVDNDVDKQGKTLVDNSVDSEGGTPDSHGDD